MRSDESQAMLIKLNFLDFITVVSTEMDQNIALATHILIIFNYTRHMTVNTLQQILLRRGIMS